MTFSALTHNTQTNLIKHTLNLDKIHTYVSATMKQKARASVSRTLYELVFPHRAKLDLDRTKSLHLLVDKAMAELPWELLSATSIDDELTPIALRAGMLRQLQ